MAMSARRPLPALAFLLALSLLTALVWWRVFHRAEEETPTPTQTCNAQSGVELPAPSAVTLTVLNGTDRNGLATQASDALAAAGFVTGEAGNEPNGVSSVAEIRFGAAGLPGATLLSYYIPDASMVPTPTRTDATIEIALGDQFPDTGGVRTAEAAEAAIAEAAAAPPSGGGRAC